MLQSLYPTNSGFSETDWKVLSKFWHPVATSDEVDNAPFSTVLLDIRLVVYRYEGRAVSALDICPHRGAQLSRGKLVSGNLQCPYHGLQFNGDGACVRIPAQDECLPIVERMRLVVFETVERYGIIWARIGYEELNAIPDWSVLEQDDIKSAPVPPEHWDVTAARHAENFNDLAHLAFVHTATFGDVPAKVPEYKLERSPGKQRHYYDDFGNTRLFDRHVDPDKAAVPKLIADVFYDYEFTFPFASSLAITAPDARTSYIFDVIQPMAAKKSRIFKIVGRNFDLDGPIDRTIEFEQAVNEEDRSVIEPMLPVHVPLNPGDEMHFRADRWSMAYRHALSKYGMGLDVDRVSPD